MVVVIVCVVIISDAAVVAILTYRSCSLAEICCSCNFQNVHKLIVTPVKKKKKSFESKRNSFLYPDQMRPVFTCVLRCHVASAVLTVVRLFANLTEGGDSISRQMLRNKEYPISGVTT